MVNIDTRWITKEIEYFGNTVTIRQVTSSVSASDWGDATETYVDTAGIKCVVYTISESDIKYRELGFKTGDLIFFFDKNNSAYMVNGNRILYDSHWYQITNIKKWLIVDAIYSYEVYTSKV